MKIIASIIFSIAAIAVIVYLLPSSRKEWLLTKAAGIIPQSFKDEAEQFLLTPEEQRNRLISQLENTLTQIEENPSNADALIEEADVLLEELRAKNHELSLGEIAKTKFVEALVGEVATSTREFLCKE